MSPCHRLLRDLRHIQVPKLKDIFSCHEDIRAFQISVQDSQVVKDLQSSGHMDDRTPDFRLFEVSLGFDMVVDLFENVTGFSDLHDNAQSLRGVVEERLFVVDDVGVGNRCKDSHFVEGILLLGTAHLSHFDLGKQGHTFFKA